MGGCETQEQKVERLITELGYKETKVRVRAAEALVQIGEGAVDAVPALMQALQDQNVSVRSNSARSLKKIGTPEALEAVEECQS